MDKRKVREIREIVDEIRDAVIYGDSDTACDGLDRIVALIEDDE